MNGLVRSMSMVLDEFYEGIHAVGISAMTGEGSDDFFAAVDAAVEEYKKGTLQYMNTCTLIM